MDVHGEEGRAGNQEGEGEDFRDRSSWGNQVVVAEVP